MSMRKPYPSDLTDKQWELVEPVIYFYLWRDEGTDQDLHDLLRWQLREKRKRLADPSLVALDTQSIHAAVGVPATMTGKGAAKRVPGRKRCLAVDVLGLVIACRMSENLRITRKTLLTFPLPSPATEPDHPDNPDHPAYQHILTALTDAGRPMRARDLCQALDLQILPKNTEGIRSKLKRLVSRGILIESGPGLFARTDA
nr:hypothetical protein [Streptomyces griseoruber]